MRVSPSDVNPSSVARSWRTTSGKAIWPSSTWPTGRPTRAVCSASVTAPVTRPYRAAAAGSARTRTVGMSACASTARSTTPGTWAMTARTSSPSARSCGKSSPKILTATLARVPDSMWSMRCEIGCPTVTFVPGRSDTRCRISSSTESRERSDAFRRTSISADSTPCTCSSSSARPVRRAVDVTSGTLSSRRSSALPSALESARLVPGIVTALMVSAPSLKSGRNDRPAPAIATRAAMSIAPEVADDEPPVCERPQQPPLVHGLQPPGQGRLPAGSNERRRREEPGAQHWRHGQRDEQRRRQRHDIREAERPEQSALDAAQREERQEHERDDHGREHDGASNLRARPVNDVEDRLPLACVGAGRSAGAAARHFPHR